MKKPEDLGKWCEERLNSVEYLQQQLVIAQEERDEARKRFLLSSSACHSKCL